MPDERKVPGIRSCLGMCIVGAAPAVLGCCIGAVIGAGIAASRRTPNLGGGDEIGGALGGGLTGAIIGAAVGYVAGVLIYGGAASFDPAKGDIRGSGAGGGGGLTMEPTATWEGNLDGSPSMGSSDDVREAIASHFPSVKWERESGNWVGVYATADVDVEFVVQEPIVAIWAQGDYGKVKLLLRALAWRKGWYLDGDDELNLGGNGVSEEFTNGVSEEFTAGEGI